MSMLAERKKKQRWSLNPRGNTWMNDKNNIGQKMLQKMGWSQGKGLGANETGIKEQIKVKYKNDNKGMGYQLNDEQWIEHEDNFNQLLENLSNNNSGNNSDNNDNKPVSLVERSESSKVRVHYKKFTRGKDLSQYSEKDLANIFGKKSLKQRETIENSNDNGGVESEGSFLKNSGSMVDYFQNKSKKFQTICENDQEAGDEGEIRCGFGFSSTLIDDKGDNKRKIDDDDQNSIELKKKRKRKKIEESSENSQEIDLEDSQESSGGKKKKKTVEKEIDGENSVEHSGKKKKKSKTIDDSLENSNKDEETVNFHVVGKGKKRPKSGKFNENRAIDNPVFEGLDSSLENSNQDEENVNFRAVGKGKKRQKSGKINDGAFDNPVFNGHDSSPENSKEENSNFRAVGKVKKRIKIEKIKDNGAVDNPAFNNSDSMENPQENCENQSDELKTNVCVFGKLKKRLKNGKTKENGAVDNPVFDCLDSSLENAKENEENSNFQVVGKVKKRKKSGKIKENQAIDNPAFDGLDSSLENSQENGSYENSQENPNKTDKKAKKNKKIKGKGAIDNPAFDDLDSSGENLQKNDNPENYPKTFIKNGIYNFVFNENLENSPNYNANFEIDENSKIPFDNPAFNSNETTPTTPTPSTITTAEIDDITCDLMLNTVTTPILKPTNRKGANKGKNVRFSDINHERIIPNKDDIEKLNELTEINTRVINGNLEEFSKRIDSLEAEIENDMNEAKLRNFDSNESVLLKIDSNTEWGKVPIWLLKTKCTAKASYKHLIKGDVVVNFKNTNFGEIRGYGKD